MVKRIVKKSRDVLWGHIPGEIEALNQKLVAVEEAIRSTELQINHNQLLLLNEINNRTKNSGVIALSETEIIVKIFSGLKMYLDPRDMAITPHLALDGVWEHRITTAWRKVVKPTDTVFDIGANNGYYGALAGQLTDKKKSKIVMFEANPGLIPYIKKTLAVNWLNEQTTLENLAVADKPGELTLHVLKDYIGSSSVHSNERVGEYMKNKMYLETAEEVKVQAITVDDYCKQHGIKEIDLMIMDIEGFEYEAYQGMRRMVKASPNMTFFIEFTKDGYEKPKDFYNQMLGDFGNVYVLNDDGGLVKAKDQSYEAVIGDADDWVMPVFSKNPKLVPKERIA